MNKQKNSLNKILTIIFSIILIMLFMSNIVLAGEWQGDENGGMPNFGVGSSTGLFPQSLYNGRTFTGSPDTSFPYGPWSIDLDRREVKVATGTVYCANSKRILRSGTFDNNTYYMVDPYMQNNGITYYNFYTTIINNKLDSLIDDIKNAAGGDNEWRLISSNTASTAIQGIPGYPSVDVNNPFLSEWDNADARSTEHWVKRTMAEAIATKLVGMDKTDDVPKSGVNDPHNSPIKQFGSWNSEAPDSHIYGPKVCIMEKPSKKTSSPAVRRGYEKTGDTKVVTNNQLSYILTAMENSYGDLPHTKYSPSDIQAAHWLSQDYSGNTEIDGDGIINQKLITNGGKVLYNKALEYEGFLKEISGGYTANIDASQAQVVANQEHQTFTIGPLTASYPYHVDISYMKSIYIETDTGTTLVADPLVPNEQAKLKVKCISGGDMSNGVARPFPKSGEIFYLQFLAKDANYPKSIKINATFEYLNQTQIAYNNLNAEANIYQYMGHTKLTPNDNYSIAKSVVLANKSYTYQVKEDKDIIVGYEKYKKNIKDKKGKIIHRKGDTDYSNPIWGKTRDWSDNKTGTVSIGPSFGNILYLYQPFVKMDPAPKYSGKGQPLRVALEGKRTYEVFDTKVNTQQTPPTIDLTIELGGKVWLDQKTGKENKYDGIYNEKVDKLMPNVKVSLYQVDSLNGNLAGTFVGAMTTDENGEYLFKNLNAIKQYYVKFTYNGQYYQPTIYNVNRSDSNWQNTSKGLDILTERDGFNAKFEEIGSAPENLVHGNPACKINTREELQKAGLIDEFGNITSELDKNGERKSSNEYVNQSMMDSYTCNGTTTKDLYPGVKAFVLDTKLNNFTNTYEILSFIKAQTVEILYGNPDLMHHVNQGYVLRELVDLAMRKDVYKATLEINGKTETYKYNKREHLETDQNGNSYWEIPTRISDGYYNYEYSRELYREDYDYKIENYAMDGPNTTLANLQLTEDSELKIYTTYKFTIRNRSEHIAAKVTEVVDYYDEDFTFVPDRSYIGNRNGEKVADISTSNHSIYGQATETTIPGYKNLYITGTTSTTGSKEKDLPLSDPDDETKDVYFYLTFIVNKDINRNNIVDEDILTGDLLGVGKENIAEINGYKTYYGQKAEAPNKGNPQTQEEYAPGETAGISDKNSTPGNLNPNDVPKDGKIKYENFENDTDKAPNIKIIFKKDNPRTVQGTVWEDIRNKKVELAQIGNGLRKDETGINGVRVQLVELRKGQDGIDYEYIWKEVYSGNKDKIDPIVNNSGTIPKYQIDTENANGKYKFEGFIPGNYVVRFIYGSDESSVIGAKKIDYNSGNEQENPVAKLYSDKGYKIRTGDNGYSENSEKIGLNNKSYNGTDYKSTSYQVNIDNGEGAYNNNSTASYDYNFTEADKGLYSDAKDIRNKKSDNVINIAPKKEYLVNCSNSRTEVEDYSKGPQKNKEAEILAAFENLPEYKYEKYDFETMKKLVDEFMNKTFMIAESGKINVNFEYNRDKSETSDTGHDNAGSSNYDKCGYYVLDNLDLGLEERPKAQLKTTKQITNVKVTLADNKVLFDASGRATNVLWIAHEAHGKDIKNTYKTVDNYENNLMKIPEVRQQATNKGKVQLTMDEELMHGSTIQITYAITVANVGEVDYKGNKFYYIGQVENKDNIVKTNPMKLVDYVGTQVQEYEVADDVTANRNNLEFIADKNPDWIIISADDLKNQGYINSNLEENVNKYSKNHIITTEKTKKDLIPIIADQEKAKVIKDKFKNDPMHALETVNQSNSVSGVQLILSKVITQDSKDDDRIYNNMTELVEVKNDVGRRMNYSIVGNQDPTIEPYEIDADDSQEVVILPPFGQKYIYYVLGSIVAVILIAGIAITITILKKKK